MMPKMVLALTRMSRPAGTSSGDSQGFVGGFSGFSGFLLVGLGTGWGSAEVYPPPKKPNGLS